MTKSKFEIKSDIVPIFFGGGTRLTAHVGILNALFELKTEFNHMVDISGGSIVSTLYCSGKSLSEILDLALTTDFRQLKGYSIFKLLKEGGLSTGNRFEH